MLFDKYEVTLQNYQDSIHILKDQFFQLCSDQFGDCYLKLLAMKALGDKD